MPTKTKVLPLQQLGSITSLKKRSFPKHISIPLKNEIRVVEIESILFLRSDSNYTEIQFADGSKIVTSSTLKKYEEKLDPHQFIRVHNSYIIQKAQIASYLNTDNNIYLRNSQEIPVSRSRKEGLLSYLKTMMV